MPKTKMTIRKKERRLEKLPKFKNKRIK